MFNQLPLAIPTIRINTHNSACEEGVGGGVPQNSLNSKKGYWTRQRRRLLQDFHGLVVLRWVGGCLGQLWWHYPTLESGLDILRSLGDVGRRAGEVQFRLWPGSRTIKTSSTSSASQASVHVIALFVKVQSYPAGLHFHTAYINLRQVCFPVSSAKEISEKFSTGSSSVLQEANSVLRDLLSPVSNLQGFSPIQLPAPQHSYLRRGPVWAWSVPWCPWRSSSTT